MKANLENRKTGTEEDGLSILKIPVRINLPTEIEKPEGTDLESIEAQSLGSIRVSLTLLAGIPATLGCIKAPEAYQ